MFRDRAAIAGVAQNAAAWLLKFTPRPQAGVRLFCFSSAGTGGAMYRPWLDALPGSVELCAVQLPGRESRLAEPPFTSLASLVDALAPALLPCFDRPFAFFGHSMGALVAFELARALEAAGAARPAHLLVSGRRAPHLPETEALMHRLDDDALVAEIGRRYGGIPAEVLQHRDLMRLLLPGLRADMTVVETHEFVPGAPLHCPITVFGGAADSRATPAQLAAWAQHTESSSRVRLFHGGHFYFQDAGVRAGLLSEIEDVLAGVQRSAACGTSR
jgi:surfactin synthase thioesterase subunit